MGMEKLIAQTQLPRNWHTLISAGWKKKRRVHVAISISAELPQIQPTSSADNWFMNTCTHCSSSEVARLWCSAVKEVQACLAFSSGG